MSGRSWAGRSRPLAGFADIDRLNVLTWITVAATLVWAALAYRAAYGDHFAVAHNPDFPEWWGWSDQGRYYRAAKAWAALSLDPAQHWYFAGYPLLGAVFFPFAPGHPFYWVDLLCLLASGVLLALLGARLVAPPALGRLVGALTYLGTVVLPPLQLKAFVEPWTTTPTAPITLAAILLAFDLWEQPTARRAAALGLVTASILLFRPVDVGPLALAVTGVSLFALRSHRLRLVVPALAGAAIPLAVAAATYWIVFGWHRSDYLQQSAQTGFEWRLIPLHWVTLFVSPMPEFHDVFSMSQTFPWIIPGVAGMAACVAAASGMARRRHALVVAAVTLHCLVYLAYRDLHPHGLFRYGNYHYFKWCVPLFGLYAVALAIESLRRRVLAAGLGLAVALLLFSWRMTWRESPAPWLAQAERLDAHTLALPRPPSSVYDALFIPAAGGLAPIYLLGGHMQVANRSYAANADTKAFPADGGLIFTVLRPIRPGPTTITFNDDVWLQPGALHMMHAHLFWRWPHVIGVVTFYYQRWLNAR